MFRRNAASQKHVKTQTVKTDGVMHIIIMELSLSWISEPSSKFAIVKLQNFLLIFVLFTALLINIKNTETPPKRV